MVRTLRSCNNRIHKIPQLLRHLFSKFGSPIRIRQRLSLKKQLGTSGVRSNRLLRIVVRLDVENNAVVAEDDSELMEATDPRATGQHLVKLVLPQRRDMPRIYEVGGGPAFLVLIENPPVDLASGETCGACLHCVIREEPA